MKTISINARLGLVGGLLVLAGVVGLLARLPMAVASQIVIVASVFLALGALVIAVLLWRLYRWKIVLLLLIAGLAVAAIYGSLIAVVACGFAAIIAMMFLLKK